jgi:deazaflavin-dependent oxidoreductase (nitroreductase family)
MSNRTPFVPPRWVEVTFWYAHRWFVRVTGGRKGLWRPKPGKWGALRLTVTSRRSGEPRAVIVGYVEDGEDLVTMAMNGWNEGEPAWWLNLQVNPRAEVELAGGDRLEVIGRAATGAERDRLWQRWREIDGGGIDALEARRHQETAVVVLEPVGADAEGSETRAVTGSEG